jgi:hypothetical protein
MPSVTLHPEPKPVSATQEYSRSSGDKQMACQLLSGAFWVADQSDVDFQLLGDSVPALAMARLHLPVDISPDGFDATTLCPAPSSRVVVRMVTRQLSGRGGLCIYVNLSM